MHKPGLKPFNAICALLALCAAGTASSAEPISGGTSMELAGTLEEVVVVGSRRSSRTLFETMAPVDVISEFDISRTPSDELMDVLAQTVPSFNVQRLPLNDGLIFVRPATLRGMSPDQTLVLVNGKRRHRSALLGSNGAQAPDLAQIPTSMIKQVEVLRDGASAQYGSDAIAGVINIVLKSEPGLAAFTRTSQYYEGDGEEIRGGIHGGLELGDGGYLTIGIEGVDANATSRSRQRPDAIQFQQDNPELDVPDPVQNWGQPERDAVGGAVNLRYPVTEQVSAYLFGTYRTAEGVSDFNWRNPDNTSAFNPSPTAFPGFDLRTVFPTGFTPQFGQDGEDLSIVGGGEFRLGNLDLDASASFGRNEIDYFIEDTINASLGPESPTSFDPGDLVQEEFNLNLDLVYELQTSELAAPMTIAFGAERREETYEIRAGDPASFAVGPGAVDGLPSGSNGFPGFSNAQAGEFDQTSYAGYLDIEAPLLERLTVGGAVRYENFSEADDSITGKISGRYEVTPDLALRSTVSTGFRAPTPGQIFSERTSQGLDTETLNIFTNGRFSPVGAVADVLSQRDDVTIEPLDAEESLSFSAGLAYRRESGFSATVDYYRVRVDDRFGSTATLSLTDQERAELVTLGVPGGNGITGVNFFQNDFETQTQGLDVVVSQDLAFGNGNLMLSGAYNFNDTEVLDGNLENNEIQRVRFEEILPRHKAFASANYLQGPLEIFARLRYVGEWTDFAFNASGDTFQTFGAEVFADLAVTYAVTDNARIRVGAENLFDQEPDEADFQANRGLIFSRNAPYDTDGGLYYLRLDVSLP